MPPPPPPSPPGKTPGIWLFEKFWSNSTVCWQVRWSNAAEKRQIPTFSKKTTINFSMRKNRLFKCKYSKISYLTQPKYPKSWNTVLRRFVHFNKNCLFPECTFNRLFQRLSNAPTKQWTRERAKNYEILLLVTLTSVLTRMSMPDWASLILGHFGVGRWLVHKSEIFALTRHSQKQRFRMSTVNT